MIPKFRAWYGAEMYDEPVIHNGEFYLDWRDFIDGDTYDGAVLMQSTGIFDKNGVEIFEGDVVLENGWLRRIISFGTQEVEENFGDTRIFQGFNLYLGGGYPNAVMSDFEVLGNIHQHPYLLEAADGH